MPYKTNKVNQSFRKTILYVLVALLVVGLVIYLLDVTNAMDFPWSHNHGPPTVSTGSATGSNQTQSDNGIKTPTATNKSNDGHATDTGGQTNGSAASPSQWTTSKSGEITVKYPVNNTVFSPGATLSGTAKLSKVAYRLSDDVIGVVATGSLNVINGKFSGIMHFTTKAKTGHLDVFSYGTNGVELNEITISLKF